MVTGNALQSFTLSPPHTRKHTVYSISSPICVSWSVGSCSLPAVFLLLRLLRWEHRHSWRRDKTEDEEGALFEAPCNTIRNTRRVCCLAMHFISLSDPSFPSLILYSFPLSPIPFPYLFPSHFLYSLSLFFIPFPYPLFLSLIYFLLISLVLFIILYSLSL